MVKFLTGWIEQIAIAVIVASIFELILPKGNIQKYIKMVLAVYVLFNIISPFLDKDALYTFSFSELEDYTENMTVQSENNTINNVSMDKRLEKLYIEQIENDIAKKVAELGYHVESSNVQAVLDSSRSDAGINKIELVLSKKQNENEIEKVEINKVTIGNIINFGKDTDKEAENTIKEQLAEYYQINKDIISVKIK